MEEVTRYLALYAQSHGRAHNLIDLLHYELSQDEPVSTLIDHYRDETVREMSAMVNAAIAIRRTREDEQ